MTALPAGIYRITTDHDALRPDKCKKCDWRGEYVLAGTHFLVEHASIWDLPGDVAIVTRLGCSGSNAIRDDKLPPSFRDALVLVENPTVTQYLKSQNSTNLALDILERLVEAGKITLDDVKSAEKGTLFP